MTLAGGSGGGGGSASRSSPNKRPSIPPGSPAAVTYLAAQRSNRCGLQAGQIRALPDRQHLQGSCCTAMDPAAYRRQVLALQRYQALPEIPHDPYDIPVSLVKRLLDYRTQITLSPDQQRTYAAAMRASPERGPCCCHCWRWEAFEGLGKHLIADRHWRARQLGALIGDLDGCGGRAASEAT